MKTQYSTLLLSYHNDLAHDLREETKRISDRIVCFELYLNKASNIKSQWKIQSLPTYDDYKNPGI